MKVTINYMAQLKSAAGTASEEVHVDSPCTAANLIGQVAEKHGNSLQKLLLGNGGQLQSTILLFVNDTQVADPATHTLNDGDEITFLSPIAGGQS